jgi:hypothetical protein
MVERAFTWWGEAPELPGHVRRDAERLLSPAYLHQGARRAGEPTMCYHPNTIPSERLVSSSRLYFLDQTKRCASRGSDFASSDAMSLNAQSYVGQVGGRIGAAHS